MKLKRAIVLGLMMIFSVAGLAMGGQNNNRQDRRENRTERRENRQENRMNRRQNRRHRRQNWRRRRHNRCKHVM